MRKIGLIIKREYLTRVRTKGFVIGTIALPLFLFGIFGFQVFMATRQSDHPLKIAILDEAGGLADAIEQGLTEKLADGRPAYALVKVRSEPSPDSNAREKLRRMVQRAELDAYLLMAKNAAGNEVAEFHTRNPGDLTLIRPIQTAVNNAVIARRLGGLGARFGDVKQLVRGIDLKVIKITEQGESEEHGQSFVIAIFTSMLLYMTLIIYGVMTMRSVLEEKSMRVVEILVASVRPFQLLVGKILGVASVALTQYLVWLTMGALLAAYGTAVAGALRPGTSLPRIHLPPSLLGYLTVFFLAGYFLYSSLYAAVGAIVSTDQEAQQMQTPLTLVIVVGFLLFNVILRNPSSTASVALSMIPFFAPILMALRIALETPPLWQIALCLTILVLTTLGTVQIAAKIYRVGILMYGKRPSIVEIFRWVRFA